MLNNLFRLDGNPTIVGDGERLPSMMPGAGVRNFILKDMSLNVLPARRIRDVKFKDTGFPKELSRITFTDCSFEDCLFLGTHFSEVEFHGCKFTNCNFWKARFHQVYLNPETIYLGERFKVEAPNVGISIFQALLANFAEERQDQFYMLADIRFRRWKRYQIRSDVRRGHVTRMSGWRNWTSNFIYDVVAGFGYKPLHYFATTIVLFLTISALNYALIGNAVQINGANLGHTSFVDSVFYTFSILTVLGFSSIIPATDGAKLLTVVEALVSIGWLGVFTSVLVKRFLR